MSSSTFTLYHYWRSSCSWRVRWALNLKEVSYTKVHINLLTAENRSPTYLALNPAGAVPTLAVGDVHLTESLPIIEWLDESIPVNPLLPTSPMDRWQVRRLAMQIAAGTQPLQNLKMLQYISSEQAERHAFAKHWNKQGLAVFETLVQESAGTYCVGSTLSIADICLIPQCYNALRFGVNLESFPTIHRIYHRCLEREDCLKAAPKNQKEAS